MRSKTKLALDDATIIRLFEKAGIPGAENIAPLGAGEYNSVYAVDAGGKNYAIKVAPKGMAKSLTYERDMMAQEVYYYGLMAGQAGIRVPEIYASDFSKTEIPAAYFIMERLSGTLLNQAELSGDQKLEVEQKLAAMAARMHAVKGEKFGYRQNGLLENWYLALVEMVTNLIRDCRRLGRRTRNGEKLLAYIRQNQSVLEKVGSSLINFDIWPANIIIQWEGEEFNLAWIDPERCLWGDRIADFVPLDFMHLKLDEKTGTIEAYNRASNDPIEVGNEERIRYAIMLGYLALVMEVEKYARYSLFHYGYWRNVAACKMYFSSCFEQLDQVMK
ncbi:MAG: phosphotransferase family protein [Anaerolineales bacterium]